MNNENPDVADPQKKVPNYNHFITSLEVGDRIVYLENGKSQKGPITEIATAKNGLKQITFQPDKVNGNPNKVQVTLTEGATKKIDGLFSINKEGVKRNREFAFLEFSTALSNNLFYGLRYDNIGVENTLSLLAGNRTNVINDIGFSYTEDGVDKKVVANARLELTRNKQGQLRVSNHKEKPELSLDAPFYGRTFSNEEKKQLFETGTLGYVDGFTNTKTGEIYGLWVGLDHQLKRPMARPAFAIKADAIYGKKLNKKEQALWLSGKPVVLEGVGKNKVTRVYIANGASRNKNGIASYTLEKAKELGIIDDPNKKSQGNKKAEGKSAKSGLSQSR